DRWRLNLRFASPTPIVRTSAQIEVFRSRRAVRRRPGDAGPRAGANAGDAVGNPPRTLFRGRAGPGISFRFRARSHQFRRVGAGECLEMSATEREVLDQTTRSGRPDKSQLKTYYHQMLAIRRMEEALAKAYALRKFGGFLHLYIGQEAVAVGALASLKPEDYVIATYREHAHAYAKGMSAKEIIAELFG